MKPNWAFDENGNLRRELYTVSCERLDEMEREGLPSVPDWCGPIHSALASLEPGDTIYIHSVYCVAEEFGGRMTFRQLSGCSGSGPCLFCRTDNGGGGFISPEMLVNRNNPKSPTPDPTDPNRSKDDEHTRTIEFRTKRGTWPIKTR